MSANPHFYDYIHSLHFEDNGKIEFVDGAGQVINTVARGGYRLGEVKQNSAEISFIEVVKVNPYEADKVIAAVGDFAVRVTREEGLFSFAQEIMWKIQDEQETPCLLYTERYVFETDPLAFGRSSQSRNLYYITESRELVESARYYYPRNNAQILTIRQLKAKGLMLE